MEFWETHHHPDWHAQAACRDLPQTWFFGAEEQPGKKRHRPTLNMAEVARAQAHCMSCPVLEQCLAHALSNYEEYGIWGGTTGRERKRWWQQNDPNYGKNCSFCGEKRAVCVC